MSVIKNNILALASKIENNSERLFTEELTAEELVAIHEENSKLGMTFQYLNALAANEAKIKPVSPIIQA